MKYFIISGEASGDLHGAGLISQLQRLDPLADFTGLGGDKMQRAGCKLVQHYRNMAFMGISAVLRNIHKVNENFRLTQNALLNYQPDALILIDYPSFNLRIAKFCKKHLPCVKIFYYIPPKIWAWKSWRVHNIAELSNLVLAIFPFEPAFYRRYGYEALYVGNPTMDSVLAYQQAESNISSEREHCIAILPGSRKQEIEKCLPTMLQAARNIEGYKIVVAGAPSIESAFYEKYLQGERIVFDETYRLLSHAEAAIVNSGTATLEAALLRCPQVAVYHIACGRFLWNIRQLVFKIPFFTLVNILGNKEVIKEYIGPLFTASNIENGLRQILTDTACRSKILKDYDDIAALLGNGNAAENAAKSIANYGI